ncbi:signal peptidase II [Pseudodesulfovibrio senegalensis]|jgi:signal peptidase II|uniref:Lipoprotein signal peptidase n=1 Tax=Pseudodesulfovibrio senegalensis TaxID=1721087 RepID=A0A6N6MZJ2_9BACT|nr:signal peptidase II [Pseudodesulfovibrio senegalensis]KAB1441111.1 signal peptidase II [Pseudodesulfovibrio senegalensis]
MNRYSLAAIWAAISTILDQGTKLLILEKFPMWSSKTIIPGFFNLVHVHNKGTAWGVLDRDDISWQVPMFIAITLIALGFIIYMLKKTDERDKWMVTGLGLIGGGAIGNLIDRIRLGEVVDFLDFYIGTYHWPAFNVADSALTIGAGAILISMYLNRDNATPAA